VTAFLDIDYQRIIEGILMAADQPISIEQIAKLFTDPFRVPSVSEIRQYLHNIESAYLGRSVELKVVATGYRFQVSQDVAPWIQKLWQVRPIKYSRALLEILALIAYRQPITRAEIEEVRGVAVSTPTIKTLLDREWIKVAGHKEVPGKPALYITTKQFLNDLNLTCLTDLPSLSDVG
jgi:segregation and condensation protein B